MRRWWRSLRWRLRRHVVPGTYARQHIPAADWSLPVVLCPNVGQRMVLLNTADFNGYCPFCSYAEKKWVPCLGSRSTFPRSTYSVA